MKGVKPRIRQSSPGCYWTCHTPGEMSKSCGMTPKLAYSGWESNRMRSENVVDNKAGLRIV